jgi:predicted alpha/beta hydrolase
MLSGYAGLCGWTLARAHARSGDRVAIASYIGGGSVLDVAIADFAAAYADLNARDYAALVAAVADGRITVDHELP